MGDVISWPDEALKIGWETFWRPEILPDSHVWIEHVPFSFWLVKALQPKNIVEIGAHTGVSYFSFCQAVKSFRLGSKCTAVGTWEGDPPGGACDKSVYEAVASINRCHYGAFSRLLRTRLAEARGQFPAGSVDLLHIDGLLTDEAASEGFRLWRDAVSAGGIVLFHNTNLPGRDVGARRLFSELKADHPHFEFEHGHGLGVLGIGSGFPAPLDRLFDAAKDPGATCRIRQFFSLRGAELRDVQALYASMQGVERRRVEAGEGDACLVRSRAGTEAVRQEAEVVCGAPRPARAEIRRDAAEPEAALAQDSALPAVTSRRLTVSLRGAGRAVRRLRRAVRILHSYLRFAPMVAREAARLAQRDPREALVYAIRRGREFHTISKAGLFDPAWYLETNPDVAAAGLDPLAHFVMRGGREGRRPVPLFDTRWYQERNQDVAAAGVNPLYHYIVAGAREGRDPNPYFDSRWYLAMNRDVARRGLNPLRHYLAFGQAEGRPPSPRFDPDWYRRTYAAALPPGADPLAHFLLHGLKQGHAPVGEEGVRRHARPFAVIPHYIDPRADVSGPTQAFAGSVAVHLHLYYRDMLEPFQARLQGIPVTFDLYVSVPETSDEAGIAEIARSLREALPRAGDIVVEAVPNRGRDIAPLIIQFGKRLARYDIVGHFHTKKSPHNPRLRGWCDNILDLLLGPPGSSGGRVSQIFALLADRAKIVYPEGTTGIRKEPTGWAGNYDLAADILDRYSTLSITAFPVVEFAEGSMFWARSAAIKAFLELPLAYTDFPAEPIPPDGTLAHALERLLFILASPQAGDLVRLHKGDSVPDYTDYEEQQDYSARIVHEDIRVLSYYLPQFHPIPENDLWHGPGFTEWTKVRAANPLFADHYQQHIPHPDIGYYLLDNPEVLRAQWDSMRKAGVHGQIFYHYWFSGKLILEEPAQMLLRNPDIPMPFCFCWANENWTRRWDGSEHEILLEQRYSAGDARDFIRYLIPFFKDARYIRIEDRPVLFVYRPSSIPDARQYLDIWGEECRAAGLKAPYVVAVLAAGARDPRDFGMDAGAERVLYDWTAGKVGDITARLAQYTPIQGRVFSYKEIKEFYCQQTVGEEFPCFRSLVPNWDNTARYGAAAHALHGSTPKLFQEWLETLIAQAKRTLPADRRFVLINAWNEWAEGAHLEPDTRYGYSYLNAIGRALSDERYANPAQDSWQALAIARAAERARRNGAILMVTHRWGGGTERHVQDLAAALERDGVAVFFARVDTTRPDALVVIASEGGESVDLASFDMASGLEQFVGFLRRLHVRHVHLQHLADLPNATADWLQFACRMAGLHYDVSLHDYMAICPRINLVDARGAYCGEPSLTQCEACIARDGSPFGKPFVWEWRQRYARLLAGARRCFVPDEDVAARLARYFPGVSFTVRRHLEPRRCTVALRERMERAQADALQPSASAARTDGMRHVVVIGHIIAHKGSELLLQCARYARERRLPVRFTIVGTTDREKEFSKLGNVTVTGSYAACELLEIVDNLAPDLAFLPSVCPETYSFTLSDVAVTGVYPVTFDLGALASRIRALNWGRLLPREWMQDAAAVVGALMDTVPLPPTPAVLEFAKGHAYPIPLVTYYGLDWPVAPPADAVSAAAAPQGRAVTEAGLECRKFTAPGREVALLVTHSADGRLKPHLRAYLEALKSERISIYLIVAADRGFAGDSTQLQEIVSGLFVRENQGYDFAAWAHVLRTHPELLNVDLLYLANDSVIGPLGREAFHAALSRIRQGKSDIYGMTENFEKGWHLQSYFLAIKAEALRGEAFKNFIMQIQSLDGKESVINSYEVGFSSAMEQAGLSVEALFPVASERNPTLYSWKKLVEMGFPFIKVQALRDEIPGVDRSGWRDIARACGLDLRSIEDLVCPSSSTEWRLVKG